MAPGEAVLHVYPLLADCRLYAPDGSLEFLGDVQNFTQLWQRWVDRGQSWGTNWRAVGRRDPAGGAVSTQTFASLVWPSVQGRYARIEGCSLGIPVQAQTDDPSIVFNSCMMFEFYSPGTQITYNRLGSAIKFWPRSQHELDAGIGIVDSRFVFTTVGCDDGALTALEFETRAPGCGGIMGSFIEACEINSGPTGRYGILVRAPIAGSRFSQNQIRCSHLHGAADIELLIEGGGAGPIQDNIYTLGISTEHPAARGIVTSGKCDVFHGSIHGPSQGGKGIHLTSSSRDNVVFLTTIEGGVLDEGQGNKMLAASIPQPQTDPDTELLLHCNGAVNSTSFPDSSKNNHTVTVNGGVHIEEVSDAFNQRAARFDVGGWLGIADHPGFDFSDGTFSVEARVKLAASGGERIICSQANDASNHWHLQIDHSDRLVARFTQNGSEIFGFSPPTPLPVGQVVHVALVENGNDWFLFVNGQPHQVTNTFRAPHYTGPFEIGRTASPGNEDFMVGWLHEIRVSRIARWTAAFTPPTAPY